MIEPSSFPDRGAFDEAVADALQRHGADVVVTAGYMRLLGRPVLTSTVAAGSTRTRRCCPRSRACTGCATRSSTAKVTGVTVFLVDEGIDTGPIVLQEAIDVRDEDDRDSLEARVLEVEHRLPPRAVRALVEGRLVVEGRHVTITEEHDE